MVSKAREDLPEPDRPVMTVRLLRGISRLMFFRLCWRAARIEIRETGMELRFRLRRALAGAGLPRNKNPERYKLLKLTRRETEVKGAGRVRRRDGGGAAKN